MTNPKQKILVFAGSTREQSLNKKLAKLAKHYADTLGAEATYVDLRDLAIPLYDGDVEARGEFPAGAKRLKELMIASDGFIIASPEYNSSISGVLKNVIDWTSRPQAGENSLAAFAGKAAALMSASPGALGGLRGLIHVRSIFGNINVHVLPQQLTLSNANEAFQDDGDLKDEKKREQLKEICVTLMKVINGLKS